MTGGFDMHVLLVGNLGYVGSVFCRYFRNTFPMAKLIGFDSGLFAHCLTTSGEVPEVALDRQYYGDVREFPIDLLRGVDAVIYLAAVSNDPMGVKFEAVTGEINRDSAISLAAAARAAGVKFFTFASSCSVYGAGGGAPRIETDPLNPLTAYARSKIETESALGEFADGDMFITCLRFATACGMSDRLRLDLVLNDFVASALATGSINVMSDGSPWRPLIHVLDMSRAIDWSINRTALPDDRFLVVNVGSNEWNYQVRDLAHAVAAAIPHVELSINLEAAADKRSYRVDFSKFARVAPERYLPKIDLTSAISDLILGLNSIHFADKEFRSSNLMRLNVLEQLISKKRLTPSLRWM